MRSALAFCVGPAALAGLPPPFMSPRDEGEMVRRKTPPKELPPAEVWMVLARRALAVDDARDALRCFEGALSHDPRLAMAHLGRAVCLAQLEREPESGDALHAAIEGSRGQEEVLYSLARMCATKGQTKLAIPLLMEAIRAIPSLEQEAMKDRLFADHPAYLVAMGKL